MPTLEPDLAGYTGYRREEGKPFHSINKMLKTPLYYDSSIQPRRHCVYEVTAVDLNGNESTLLPWKYTCGYRKPFTTTCLCPPRFEK